LIVEFVRTGVPGLDEILGGGVIRGSSILIVGPAGTMKHKIGLQFLREGLLSGERAIYISAVHTLRDVEFLMKINLEFDVEPYVKGGQFAFVDAYDFLTSSVGSLRNLLKAFVVMVNNMLKAESSRSVVSLTPMLNIITDDSAIARFSLLGTRFGRQRRSTTLLILDEKAQNQQAETFLKSMCDYVLITSHSDGATKIKVYKSPMTCSQEWHTLIVKPKGVEIVKPP